jgi:hypothetical protein
MMDYRIWRQRHEELLREAELSRRAKALRVARKRGAGRRSILAWEIKRQAGRLFKFLRTLSKAGSEGGEVRFAERKSSFWVE